MDDVNTNLTSLGGELSSEIRSIHCSNTLSNIDPSDYSSSEKEDSDSKNSDVNNNLADGTSNSSMVDENIQHNFPFWKTSMAELQSHHTWLYFGAIDDGYKCEVSDIAVKNLTDHPKLTFRHKNSSKHIYAVKHLAICESEVTELELEKLLRINIFMVKKYWAHISNNENFVKFIGNKYSNEVAYLFILANTMQIPSKESELLDVIESLVV